MLCLPGAYLLSGLHRAGKLQDKGLRDFRQTNERARRSRGPAVSVWSYRCRLRKCMSRGQKLGEGDIRRGMGYLE